MALPCGARSWARRSLRARPARSRGPSPQPDGAGSSPIARVTHRTPRPPGATWGDTDIAKLILGVGFNVAVFGGLLFLPAGTLDWWRAWVLLGAVVVGTVASTVTILRVNKAVLEKRFKLPIQAGQPFADKIVVLLLVAGFVGVVIFIPLDVFRLHLIARCGTLVSSLGLVLFVVGWWIMTLALRENAFAAPVVKHQDQQTVIDSGVYRVVRHPMYAGAVLLFVGMPLWLQSYAAAGLAIVPIGTLVVRIGIEEELLRRELPGYDAYVERVRYRLTPLLW